jgi:rhodanese-related sulfurtransferase
MINTEQAVEWFYDPNQEQYQYVWVDARKADLYKEGHIQGAYPLPHFNVEQYIDTVMSLLLTAQKIIVYCEGGDCEDSLLLARHLLTQAGLPWEKLYVYKDGLEGWRAQGHPIAKGEEP